MARCPYAQMAFGRRSELVILRPSMLVQGCSELGGHGCVEGGAAERQSGRGTATRPAHRRRPVYAAGSSYLDAGSGSPDNDFTNRAPRFTTSNLMHLAWMLKQVGGMPAWRCSVLMTSPGKALGLLRWSGPVLTGRPAAGYGEKPAT